MLSRYLEQVARCRGANVQGFDRMRQVVDRAGQGCQVKDTVDRSVDFQRTAHVPLTELKVGVRFQMLDVPRCARYEIVDPEHFVAF
jgi:hypothetical protein